MRIATNLDQVTATLQGLPATAEGIRRSQLAQLAQMQAAHVAGLDIERRRLETKYGADSPQAKAAAARLSLFARERAVVAAEVARMDLTAPRAAEDRFVVWGRVVTTTGAGVAGVRVAAVTPDGKELASATSKEGGRFELSVPAASAQSSQGTTTRTDGQTFRLQVLVRKDGTPIMDDEEFDATAGQLAYREIVVPAQDTGPVTRVPTTPRSPAGPAPAPTAPTTAAPAGETQTTTTPGAAPAPPASGATRGTRASREARPRPRKEP